MKVFTQALFLFFALSATKSLADTKVFLGDVGSNSLWDKMDYNTADLSNKITIQVPMFNPGCKTDNCNTTQEFRVSGLSFDSQTNEIIFQDSNQKVVCATLAKGFLGIGTHVRPSGHCSVVLKQAVVIDDDGAGEKSAEKINHLYFVAF